MIPDYCTDKMAAMQLVHRLTNFYHSKGYTSTRFWLSPRIIRDEQGEKVITYYDIRSNLRFNADCLKA